MKIRSLEVVIAVVLGVAVVVSGLWLVEAKHEARQLFAELEELKREQDRLQVDWGRLQIEESTFGTQSRIESLALEEIDLGMPRNDQIVVVTGPPK